MAKSKTQSSFHSKVVHTPKVPTQYKDRNLMGISPLKEQFEPTEAMPVRTRVKMAGGA